MLLHTKYINLQNIKKWAILDSGATSLFLALGVLVREKIVAKKPIVFILPDGDQAHSTHTGDCDMSQLPAEGQYCHIILRLAKYFIISVVKLFEAGYKFKSTKSGLGVEVQYRRRLLLTVSKYTKRRLSISPYS